MINQKPLNKIKVNHKYQKLYWMKPKNKCKK